MRVAEICELSRIVAHGGGLLPMDKIDTSGNIFITFA